MATSVFLNKPLPFPVLAFITARHARVFTVILLSFLLPGWPVDRACAQYLSHLHATREDPVYTVYASALERTSYKLDQGYSLSWLDPEKPVGFESRDGGGFGLLYRVGTLQCGKLKECYKEPIIVTSYPDLVRLYYYPLKDLRVEVFFTVYSSTILIAEITLFNESHLPLQVEVQCVFDPGKFAPPVPEFQDRGRSFRYTFQKKRDAWMTEHNIPYEENLQSLWANTAGKVNTNGFQQEIPLIIPADSLSRFRLIRVIGEQGTREADLQKEVEKVKDLDLWILVNQNEKLFSSLEELRLSLPTGNEAKEDPGPGEIRTLFYSCFSLMRQCMMAPEGECRQNYYVFSREPKWGWGYGGQVFHESLCMLAYARLDPLSAMNAQRIFIERQHADGYINYRTGPYLNETIETNGMLTSSAPWFNYENLGIYQITRDTGFLREAYLSGKRFFEYYTRNRDADRDGMYEWGAHATLESVRDARVAVWDEVCDPSLVEGPDLNSMLVKEARSLAGMAKELDYTDEAIRWTQQADQLASLINRYMWDSISGFYYNINKNNHTFNIKKPGDLKRKEIIGFLPLWAGVCNPQQAKQLMKSMLNPAEFWRPYGIPTLSAGDPYYNPMGYWNGPVWIPWQYLVYRGLKDYGYAKEARELSLKVARNVIHQLKSDHAFWEFYSPDARQAGWNKVYIWTGLLAEMLL